MLEPCPVALAGGDATLGAETVERIIGFKRGTGGSDGVSYLVKALDRKLFPELLTLRTAM